MKHFFKGLLVFFICLVVIVAIPLGLNVLFKIPALCDWLVAEWDAGDVLGYYGALLGGVVSFVILYLTLKAERKHEHEKEKEASRVFLELSREHKSKRIDGDRYLSAAKRSYLSADRLLIENITDNYVVNLTVRFNYSVEGIKKESSVQFASIPSKSRIHINMPDEISNAVPFIPSDLDKKPDGPKSGILEKIIVFYYTSSFEKMKVETDADISTTIYSVVDGEKEEQVFTCNCSPVDEHHS